MPPKAKRVEDPDARVDPVEADLVPKMSTVSENGISAIVATAVIIEMRGREREQPADRPCAAETAA
jgi:hypothetical protein